MTLTLTHLTLIAIAGLIIQFIGSIAVVTIGAQDDAHQNNKAYYAAKLTVLLATLLMVIAVSMMKDIDEKDKTTPIKPDAITITITIDNERGEIHQ